MNNHNKNIGNTGEDIAKDWLEKQGYTIIERNWRHSHWEVDIIASKKDKLHFVEVKTRNSHRYGKPEESFGKNKMKSLKNAAEEYQHQHPEWEKIQFDILAITLQHDEVLEIFLIEDVYF